jgi:uncharacterized damage-inducible protein DinB
MYHQLSRMFARYNAWANARLYGVAATLSPEQFAENRGAFFGGLSGTLNHLLATDRIWLRRFTGTGNAPTSLDIILHAEFAPLWEARQAEDARIIAWVDGLDEEALAANFTYQPVTNPRDITQPLAPALAHLFNHQTHHRGQAHTILTGFGKTVPSLDLIQFQREVPA